MRTSDLIRRVFSRACNDGDSHIMHSSHVFMVQSRLAGDEILPDLFLEGTSIHIYTREDRATRSERQPRLHSGLQIRVQEIPGIRALGDIPSWSILHFPRLTFLTPPDATLHGEYIRLAFEEDVFLWRKTCLQSINSWNEMYTRSRKESRQVDRYLNDLLDERERVVFRKNKYREKIKKWRFYIYILYVCILYISFSLSFLTTYIFLWSNDFALWQIWFSFQKYIILPEYKKKI